MTTPTLPSPSAAPATEPEPGSREWGAGLARALNAHFAAPESPRPEEPASSPSPHTHPGELFVPGCPGCKTECAPPSPSPGATTPLTEERLARLENLYSPISHEEVLALIGEVLRLRETLRLTRDGTDLLVGAEEDRQAMEAKLLAACGTEPSAGHDAADEIIGLLRVARGQRDEAWEELRSLRRLRADEEGRRVRPEVLAFAQAMEVELRENDGKGGWEDCGTEWLLHRMTEERRELTEAVKRRHAALGATSKRETAAAVLSEAADVANFAMMIADVCGALALAPSPSLPDAPLPDGRDATREANPNSSTEEN
jgi:NTP pyrophosphatase (non-canonical NTP hydrolase)